MPNYNNDTGVNFQDQTDKTYYHAKTPKIIGWIIRYSGGIIKNENQAAYAIMVFFLVSILLFLFSIFASFRNDIKPPSSDLIDRYQPEEGYIPRR